MILSEMPECMQWCFTEHQSHLLVDLPEVKMKKEIYLILKVG